VPASEGGRYNGKKDHGQPGKTAFRVECVILGRFIQEDRVNRRRLIVSLFVLLASLELAVLTGSVSAGMPGQAPGVSDVDAYCAFGSKTAPLRMEVYSDFQCPACKQLFKTTNQPLMDNYVNTGKVYLIHRDFPLPMHAYSRVAASYARAAAHIGKFEVVEQALFQNQEKWEANGDVKGTVTAALSPAEMKKVQALVDGKTLEPLIDKDKQAGQLVPVNQTPTTVFHYKGQTYPYAGVMSYDILKQFLDQLLSQK